MATTPLDGDPNPVKPDPDGKQYKVTVLMSPDHSIKEFADFIMSATKSVDAYIPGVSRYSKVSVNVTQGLKVIV